MLGHLISMKPQALLPLLKVSGSVISVKVETTHTEGRSDILLETTKGIAVIEAKIGPSDAVSQLRKYPARWYILLSSNSRTESNKGTTEIGWREIAKELEMAAKNGPEPYRYLVKSFVGHLQEHNMVSREQTPEIYAREINEPITLGLFLKSHLYGCNYEKINKISLAKYFTPHFGASIANEYPGISQGISYIAKIEEIFIASDWKEFEQSICTLRGKQWWNSHSENMQSLKKSWNWSKNTQRNFLLLGQPRMVFNPAIRKERLQTGKGWLSKRFFSFDELFEAWGSH